MVDAKTKAPGRLALGPGIAAKIQAAASRGGLEW